MAIEIDLQSFCGADDIRKWLRAPFSGGEFTYATDGRIAVRVPRRSDAPELTDPKFAKAPEVLDKWFAGIAAAEFESTASIVLPDTIEKCEDVECDSCDARGYDHDCPECTCVCAECGGSGRVRDVEKISIEALGAIWRLPFLRKVLSIPGLEIASTPRGDGRPALFRFDGGFAALMPLHRHYETRAALVSSSEAA